MPANQHQYVVGTRIFRHQPENFGRFSLAEWRHHPGRDAAGRERELDVALQIVVPAESLFFGSVGINNDFVVDSFFTNAALAQLGHGVLDSMIHQSAGPSSSSM